MKRLIGSIIFVLVLYVIYFDLSHGTLPVLVETKIEAKTEEKVQEDYFEHKVKPGETVLNIVENQLNGPIPSSIEAVVNDFGKLNNGIKPEKIQIGKTYKFPIYKE